jgi:cytochrome c peroxidase
LKNPSLKYALFFALVAAAFAVSARTAPGGQSKDELSRIILGERLFKDDRFSSRDGDLAASCSDCHVLDQKPQAVRAFTDSLPRSWVPWRSGDPRRDGLRNAPTLFDVAEMPRLHLDGEFESLEDLVRGTLAGRPLGWLPGEEAKAFRQVYRTVLDDKGDPASGHGPYRAQFSKAYGVDLAKLSEQEVIDLIARAMSEFMRRLKTERDSPYDKFVQMNGLETGPRKDELPALFARRLLARISHLESRGELKLAKNFSTDALAGMKIFFSTEGDRSAGNCVSCHRPPLFTDFTFHNTGATQGEYDRIHGEGSFARLKIPSASEAARPAVRFREIPLRDKPGYIDLGHWNIVNLSTSPLRRAEESEDRFLERMIGTFKTPTLRNLAYSEPYLHNGAYFNLEDVLAELMRMSRLARAGRVREADEELARIKISESDIPRLVAFLNALNEDL